MSLLRYPELIVYRALANLRAEVSRTYVSFLWWVLDPLLYLGVFYTVFGLLLENHTEHFVSFLLIGLVLWKWFSGSVQHAVDAIVNHQGLIQQVYLPKVLFPLIEVTSDLLKFLIVFALLLMFVSADGAAPAWNWLYLLPLLGALLVLIAGLACLAAGITPFFPDVRLLIESGLMMLMFVSGVFFSADQIPEGFRQHFFLNPVALALDDTRRLLLQGRAPEWSDIGYVAAIGVGVCVAAAALMVRADRLYPKLARA